MYALERVTPPAVPVITGAEVVMRLEMPEAAAGRMTPFVTAAEQYFDGNTGYLGRALIEQVWDLYFDTYAFPDGLVRIPLPPMIAIKELAFETDSGALEGLPEGSWRIIRGETTRLAPVGFRLNDYRSFRLRFACGYGAEGTAVPEPIRQAITLRAAHLASLSRPDVQLIADAVTGIGSSTWAVSEAVGKTYETAADNLVSGYKVPVL